MARVNVDLVRELMKGAKLNADELAKRAKINRTTVFRMLSEPEAVTLATIGAVADALGVEPADIIERGTSQVDGKACEALALFRELDPLEQDAFLLLLRGRSQKSD